jgi:hypothetical protein
LSVIALSLVHHVFLRSKVDSTSTIDTDSHGDVLCKCSHSRWYTMFTLLRSSSLESNDHGQPRRDLLQLAVLSLVYHVFRRSKADGTSTISTNSHGDTSCEFRFSRWCSAFVVLIPSFFDLKNHGEPRRDSVSLSPERIPTRMQRFPCSISGASPPNSVM